MKLTKEQCQKLLHDRGIWVTNACDKCGQLLGSVRWTRRGEPGEWCSAECRDGVSVSAPKLAVTEPLAFVRRERIGAWPTGRPKKHANNAEKCRCYRQNRKTVLATRNTPSQSIENAQLADAKNASRVVHPCRAPEGLETAPRIEFLSACQPARS
jgi:hypothetical protein